jgi:hypothetical protein
VGICLSGNEWPLQGAAGFPIHGRTLDWHMPVLKTLAIEVVFQRRGVPVCRATTWAGYVGVLTGRAALPHLRRDWARPTSPTGLGSPIPTSALRLGSSRPDPRRDWARNQGGVSTGACDTPLVCISTVHIKLSFHFIFGGSESALSAIAL